MNGQEIADAVNHIIKYTRKEQFNNLEAINWGDLSVNEVNRIEPMYPDSSTGYIEVIINEADPSSWRFCEYIQNKFKQKYGTLISIKTEW